jgi:serine/threonine protein kinase
VDAFTSTRALQGVDGFAAVLEKGTMPDARAKDVMWQLASAVAYCHSKRIVQ